MKRKAFTIKGSLPKSAVKSTRTSKGKKAKANWGGRRKGAGRQYGSLGKNKVDLDKAIKDCLNVRILKGESPSAQQLFEDVYLNMDLPSHVRLAAMDKVHRFQSAPVAPTKMSDPNAGHLQNSLHAAREDLKRKLSTFPAPTGAGSVDQQPEFRNAKVS